MVHSTACCNSEEIATLQEILSNDLQDNTLSREDLKLFIKSAGEMDETARVQFFGAAARLVLRFGSKILPLITRYGLSAIVRYGSKAVTAVIKGAQRQSLL